MINKLKIEDAGLLQMPAGKFLVEALKELQAQCGVAGMKLSDYGIDKADIPAIAQNARDTMGGLVNGLSTTCD